jgi:hypothetical protein
MYKVVSPEESKKRTKIAKSRVYPWNYMTIGATFDVDDKDVKKARSAVTNRNHDGTGRMFKLEHVTGIVTNEQHPYGQMMEVWRVKRHA